MRDSGLGTGNWGVVRACIAMLVMLALASVGFAQEGGGGGGKEADPTACKAAREALSPYLPAPEAVPGWRVQGQPAAYLPKTLYEYINGAAETFLGFDFRRLLAADYLPPDGEGHVTVDIYDRKSVV